MFFKFWSAVTTSKTLVYCNSKQNFKRKIQNFGWSAVTTSKNLIHLEKPDLPWVFLNYMIWSAVTLDYTIFRDYRSAVTNWLHDLSWLSHGRSCDVYIKLWTLEQNVSTNSQKVAGVRIVCRSLEHSVPNSSSHSNSCPKRSSRIPVRNVKSWSPSLAMKKHVLRHRLQIGQNWCKNLK